jgi:hypothetical protein
VSKYWAKIEALVVSTKAGLASHMQGWCIRALIKMS